ncbi:GNAT family N-acetyltransferase [Bradyrhizobium genosp. A]|uniref:GNAT family N-acetyltransferase n=1 Tax=Bradyrhizobium genosp. A TaxID=83626 RepID=UPI003CEF65A3
MQRTEIEFVEFAGQHLDDALKLTVQAGWSQRRDDWAMLLGLGSGHVALLGDQVIGLMCMTIFGEVATVGLLIVHENVRGRGLGNRLMKLALEKADGRECRLIATSDGMPLYRKLGFTETETIRVHRGVVAAVNAPPDDVEWAAQDDLGEIFEIDWAATGFDRRALISKLWERGRFAVMRSSRKVVGYSAVLSYGHGEVVGPVVAGSADEAKRLLSFLFSHCTGASLRFDFRQQSDLADWLNSIGLAQGGSLTAMRHGKVRCIPDGPFQSFALATNQYGFP